MESENKQSDQALVPAEPGAEKTAAIQSIV